MKRTLSLALTILMLVSLAACGAPGDGASADAAPAYKDGPVTPFLLTDTRMTLSMPENWSFFYRLENVPWAFFSPDAETEFDVFPLELQEGETVDDLLASLKERSEAGDEGVRELKRLSLKGCRCLTYVDEAGQSCAYIRRSKTEGYRISCTDRGDGGRFFRQRLKSIRWQAKGKPSPYARKVKKYKGYEYELERIGLKAYIPKEFSFLEYDEQWNYYIFINKDEEKLIVDCGFEDKHTSPGITAMHIWNNLEKSADTQMTAGVSAQGRVYAIRQDRATGNVKQAYVRGNHGYTVSINGISSVERMRYFLDRLEDVDVRGTITVDPFGDKYDDDDNTASSHYAGDDDECGVCNGTGVCVGCNGRRRTRIPGFGGVGTAKYINCAACGGTGRCRTCGGSGRD